MKDRERYLERQRKYNRSEKGQARYARYEETRLRVRLGGIDSSERLPPEGKRFFLQMLAEYRERRDARPFEVRAA